MNSEARIPLSPKKSALSQHNILQSPHRYNKRLSPGKDMLASQSLSKHTDSEEFLSFSPIKQLSPRKRTDTSADYLMPCLGSSPSKRARLDSFLTTPSKAHNLNLRENSSSPRKRPSPVALSAPLRQKLTVPKLDEQGKENGDDGALLLSPPPAARVSPSPLKQASPLSGMRRQKLGVRKTHPLRYDQYATLPAHPFAEPHPFGERERQNSASLHALLTPPRPVLQHASVSSLPDPMHTAPARLSGSQYVQSAQDFVVFVDAVRYEATPDSRFEHDVDVDVDKENVDCMKLRRYSLRSSESRPSSGRVIRV
jgi:hypothetical protein